MPSRDLERLMWAEACEMLDRAQRLQRSFFRPAGHARTADWEPPIDVYEASDGLWLVIAMPGALESSISVRVEHAELVVSARRPLPTAAHRGTVRRMEIPHGYFERRLALPPGEYQLQEQQWQDGCLHLALRFVK